MIGHPYQWFGNITYAQHGDDLAVLNIFKRVGIDRATYMDVGANDPFLISNTALLYQRGWRGVNVEADPDRIALFNEHRPFDQNLNFAVVGDNYGESTIKLYRHAESGINSTKLAHMNGRKIKDTVEVTTITVPQLVSAFCRGQWPDFLSIDAEGQDMEILHSIPPAASAVILVEAFSLDTIDYSKDIRKWASDRGYYVHSWLGNNMLLVQQAWREGLS